MKLKMGLVFKTNLHPRQELKSKAKLGATAHYIKVGNGRSQLDVENEELEVGQLQEASRVGNLPRKTELKLYFELGVNGLSVVRYFYRLL